MDTDDEDGLIIFEIQFSAGTDEYEYEISALDGAIIKFKKEADDDDNDTSVTAPAPQIDAAAAKTIALRHAGLPETGTRDHKLNADEDNGGLIFEIEFRVQNDVYAHEINAVTGAITKFAKQEDD